MEFSGPPKSPKKKRNRLNVMNKIKRYNNMTKRSSKCGPQTKSLRIILYRINFDNILSDF